MYDVMVSSQLALVLSLCKVNVNRTDVVMLIIPDAVFA